MGLEKYASSHGEVESDGRYCAEAYDRGLDKQYVVMDICDHLNIDADTAWLVVEALDAMEDMRE